MGIRRVSKRTCARKFSRLFCSQDCSGATAPVSRVTTRRGEKKKEGTVEGRKKGERERKGRRRRRKEGPVSVLFRVIATRTEASKGFVLRFHSWVALRGLLFSALFCASFFLIDGRVNRSCSPRLENACRLQFPLLHFRRGATRGQFNVTGVNADEKPSFFCPPSFFFFFSSFLLLFFFFLPLFRLSTLSSPVTRGCGVEERAFSKRGIFPSVEPRVSSLLVELC